MIVIKKNYSPFWGKPFSNGISHFLCVCRSREVGDAGINQSLACLRQAPGGACKQVSDTDSGEYFSLTTDFDWK